MSGACPAGVDPRAWAALTGAPIAHRGIWRSDGPPENSVAAFEAAAAGGYGVELDVRLSSDGEAVVFHDDALERMTTGHGRVADHTAASLAWTRLAGTNQTIPTLAKVLQKVAGRVLVLVELKSVDGREGPLERRVSQVLADYAGPVGVLGFNPASLGWFFDHATVMLRGLNVSAQSRGLDRLATAHPHFVSLDHRMFPDPAARALRVKGVPVLTWTVRNPAEAAKVQPQYADNFMFEGFWPRARAS